LSSKRIGQKSSLLQLLVVTIVAATGCSSESPQSTVRGTVTLDGAPLADGLINFVAIDQQSQTAEAKITDGRFEVAVPIGKKRVEIRAAKVVGKKKAYDTPDSPTVDIVEELLPARYNSQSELRMTVTEGAQEKAFELQSR
jgi:hypothetical protein